MTWSYCRSNDDPHSTQRPPSRSKTAPAHLARDRLPAGRALAGERGVGALEPAPGASLALAHQGEHVVGAEALVLPPDRVLEGPVGARAAGEQAHRRRGLLGAQGGVRARAPRHAARAPVLDDAPAPPERRPLAAEAGALDLTEHAPTLEPRADGMQV